MSALAALGGGGLSLSRLDTAAAARLSRALQTRAEEAGQRELDGLTRVAEFQTEAQKKIAETQNQALAALTKGQALLAESLESWRSEADADADAAETARQKLSDNVADLLKQVEALLAWLANAPRVSAGGTVGRVSGRTGDVLGWPHATGDVVWTHNILRGGWLKCNGTERLIKEFPELYNVIGRRYGTPSSADAFKLPSKAQLTADSVVLGNNGLQCFIRT
jgi:hypothetical protein